MQYSFKHSEDKKNKQANKQNKLKKAQEQIEMHQTTVTKEVTQW